MASLNISHRGPLTPQDMNRQPSYKDARNQELGALESKFTLLKDLMENKLVNVIGVVANFSPPRKTKGTDYVVQITVCDPTRTLAGTGLLCLFFHRYAENLPAPVSTGEILIAYNLKIKPYKMDIQAWSHYTTDWKLVAPGYDISKLEGEERERVKELKEWWNIMGGAPGAQGIIIKRDALGNVINEEGPSKSKKASLIGNIFANQFYDLTVEIVKIWSGDPLTLYVTDYSQNTLLHNYSWLKDRSSWKGPFGQYTLQISIWKEAIDQARICKVGDYFLLKNVRGKLNHDGKLEGSMYPDQRYHSKMLFERVERDTEEVQNIKKRKIEYENKLKRAILKVKEEKVKSQKRIRELYPSDDESSQQSQSKIIKKALKQHSLEEEIIMPKFSQKITSISPEKKPILVSQILSTNTTPSMPRKMKVQCRVRDFHPHSIVDFAVPFCNHCETTWRLGVSSICPKCSMPPEDTNDIYTWEFMILIEDVEGDTLPVIVAGNEAQELLSLHADNLRDNPKVLAQLQQKLFLLWGPLEEQLSNVAYSPSPKPIRKASRQKSSTSTSKSLRFSDDIDADDGSSSSLNERYGWEDGNGGRSGGKIVKARQGGLGHEELGKGVWFTAGIMEVWTARSEACFMEKRWILFGTRIE